MNVVIAFLIGLALRTWGQRVAAIVLYAVAWSALTYQTRLDMAAVLNIPDPSFISHLAVRVVVCAVAILAAAGARKLVKRG